MALIILQFGHSTFIMIHPNNFFFYLNQTIKKNQGAQEDLDRSVGNKHKVDVLVVIHMATGKIYD